LSDPAIEILLTLATLLSRLLGFARDILIAGAFGAGTAADAFFVAFGIPSLLRRLFAEGALSASFIPVFTSYLVAHTKEEARELVGSATSLFALTLAVVCALGVVLAGPLVSVLVPGFAGEAGKLELTVLLTRIMFPFLFFIGLSVLMSGVLNSLQHFLSPALSPAFFNMALIAVLLFAVRGGEAPVVALALAVVAGGAIQLLVQLPALGRMKMLPRPNLLLRRPELKQIVLLMLPAAFGMAITQLNVLVDRLLASYLPPGSVSFLYYANRLVQFPLGTFGIAIAVAAFPTMSEQMAREEREGFERTFSLASRLTLFIVLPAALGLILLREPIIHLLFERGEFSRATTIATSQALFYYALGLVAFAEVKIVVSAFYALQDTRTPVTIGVYAMLANIVLNLILMGPLKHGGLALATSLASALNLLLLLRLLKGRVESLRGWEIGRSLLKILPATGAMGVAVFFMGKFLYDFGDPLSWRILSLLITIGLGALLYGTLCWGLRSEELAYAIDALKRRLRRD
ncbi:MAG: murein biosynthesis integral membrane protein MurJ, partial [Nitrospinota bacterium]